MCTIRLLGHLPLISHNIWKVLTMVQVRAAVSYSKYIQAWL